MFFFLSFLSLFVVSFFFSFLPAWLKEAAGFLLIRAAPGLLSFWSLRKNIVQFIVNGIEEGSWLPLDPSRSSRHWSGRPIITVKTTMVGLLRNRVGVQANVIAAFWFRRAGFHMDQRRLAAGQTHFEVLKPSQAKQGQRKISAVPFTLIAELGRRKHCNKKSCW